MIIIVAHHYVVNSNLINIIEAKIYLNAQDIFILLFGWGGKTGINCFVLITGYFMCTSDITVKKYCKLIGEYYFYTIVIWVIFLVTGYSSFSIKEFLNVIFPFFNIGGGFTSCYLLFYLFIPFINKLINSMNEIEHRKLVVRKEAIEAVKEARAQGDLSENFEYYAAKKDKNKNESRIRYLERMIRTAKVVSDESKDDEVGLYNTVDVYFEDDDETETYKIVTTIRGNSLKGLISSESPLGRALLGHKVGDRVHVQVNDRAGYDVIIKRLEKTVDDGSDAIRSF